MNNVAKALSPSGVSGALKTDMSVSGIDDTETKLRGIQEKREPLQKKLAEAETEMKAIEFKTQDDLLEAKATQAKEDAEKSRQLYEEGKKKLSEFPDPEFHPTEENAQTLSMLFGLVATSGLLLGSSGKMSAMTSLSAMNGMLEGWRTGRADLYKREVDKFNKETERRRRLREDIRKDILDAQQLQAKDREAAMYSMQSAISKAGTNSILGQALTKQQTKTALDILDGDEKIEKQIFEIKKFKVEQQRKKEEAAAKLQQWKTVGVDASGNVVQVNPEGQTRSLPGVSPAKGGKGGAAGGGVTKGSATQQQFENITSADIGNAYFRINEWLGNAKDPDKIPTGSKFLRDRSKQAGIIDAFKNYAVNKTLPADLQANDAALLGIAFDIVAARAFGRSTGVTDAKIAEVIRQLPVEGDTEETKRMKLRVLFNQLEEPNRLLPEEKKVEGLKYMRSPKAKGFYERYSKPLSEEPAPKTAGVKSYATESEAASAAKRGELKTGEKVNIGGVSGTWED